MLQDAAPPSLAKPDLTDFWQNGSGAQCAVEMGAALLTKINGELCARSMPQCSRQPAGAHFPVSHLRDCRCWRPMES